MKTLLVSFFGGPGCGKSIFAADVFSKLKWKGYTSELAFEYAKTKVWEKSINVLNSQIYVFGKQHHITTRLLGQVQIIITDSPFLLSCIYDKSYDPNLRALVVTEYKKLWTYNIFLQRDETKFEVEGRLQGLEDSKKIDNKIINLLSDSNFDFEYVKSCPEEVNNVVDKIIEKYDSNN
jgi:tRNA uridine 5-carbamoylmethylation protein Kti12